MPKKEDKFGIIINHIIDIKDKLVEHDKRFERIETDLNTGLNSVNQKIDKLDDRVGNLENKATRIETRLSNVEIKVTEIGTDVKILKDVARVTSFDLKELDKKLDNHIHQPA